MFLSDDARRILLAHEREKFLTAEWPRIRSRIKALGLDAAELLTEEEADAPGNGKTPNEKR